MPNLVVKVAAFLEARRSKPYPPCRAESPPRINKLCLPDHGAPEGSFGPGRDGRHSFWGHGGRPPAPSAAVRPRGASGAFGRTGTVVPLAAVACASSGGAARPGSARPGRARAAGCCSGRWCREGRTPAEGAAEEPAAGIAGAPAARIPVAPPDDAARVPLEVVPAMVTEERSAKL